MKDLLIFGYFEKNLGDDLMLKIFLEEAKTLYKKIYILTSREYKNFYENMGCNAVCYDSLLYRVINRLFCRKNDKELYYCLLKKGKYDFVMLGGSLFMEGAKEQTQAQLTNLNRAVEGAQRSWVVGSNFGPFTSREYLEKYTKLFEKCVDVCFRDNYSYQLFRHLENVRYAPDIVFSGRWERNLNTTEEHVLISLIDIQKRTHLRQYAERYENFILEICNLLIGKNEKVILLSMCEKEGDLDICKRIMSKLGGYQQGVVEVYEYQEIDETLTLFANAKKVYATRFHAMILGAFYNKPVMSVVYSEKIENALLSYGFDCKIVTMSDIENVVNIGTIMEYSIPAISNEIKKEARQQIEGFINCRN